MLFKLPTLTAALALLGVQLSARARGSPSVTNVGNLFSPSNGNTFKVGECFSFKYKLEIQDQGPLYQIVLRRAVGYHPIITFATNILANPTTHMIDATFCVPRPHGMGKDPVEATLVVLQNAAPDTAPEKTNYVGVQEIDITITK